MNKLTKILLASGMLAILGACGGDNSSATSNQTPDSGDGSNPVSSLSFAEGNSGQQPAGSVMRTTLAAQGTEASFEELQIMVFSPMCSGCHTGGGITQPSLLDMTTADASYQSLVNAAGSINPNTTLVVPGDSANSHLMRTLDGTQAAGSRMPMRASPLSDELLASVRNWIDQGAER